MNYGSRIVWMCVRAALASLIAIISLSVCANEVIPDFYRDPGIYPNRSYINQNLNENIDPFSGALSHQYVDIHLPGNGGFDLDVIRSYNSSNVDPYARIDSLAGLGWTIHFGRILNKTDTFVCTNTNALSVVDNPVLELPDGSRQLLAFTYETSPRMLTAQRWRVDCPGSGLSVYSPDGIRYDMTQVVSVGSSVDPVYAWYTTRITDRNGNYAIIAYNTSSSQEISRISTSDGRLITFSYLDSGRESRRISQIVAHGQTYKYNYTAAGVNSHYLLTQVIRPDNTSWRYTYNPKLEPSPGGYLMRRATYPQGGWVDYGYDYVYFDGIANPSSRSTVVVSKTQSTGGDWAFNYVPGNSSTYDVTTVTTPSGTITYKHIGPNYTTSGTVWMAGLLVEKVTGTKQTEIYTWDKQSISTENFFRPGAFVTKVDSGTSAPMLAQKRITRDGASYTTTYSNFDSYGNPRTVTESGPNSGNRTTTLSYFTDATKWIINELEDETFTGSSIQRTFNANGNLTEIVRDGVRTSHTYDTQGNILSTTFPRSLTHNYSSYKRGIPQTESQPEGISISRVVSDAGNVTSETNAEGNTTGYSYDGLNRITAIDYPIGNDASIAYTASTKTTTRGLLTEETTYNGFGLPTDVTLGGISKEYQYDELGRRTFESNPNSSVGTRYQYDILDRQTRVTFADNQYQSVTFEAGRKIVRDERGNQTTYSYRAYGDPDQLLLMTVTAPVASANLTLARNSKGLITSVTQNTIQRTYGYNSNYYLTSLGNPETGTTTYGRDAAGNMTSRQVGSSSSTTYTYDDQNRLETVTYPTGTPSVTNTYNKLHKLRSVSSTAAVRSYNYDDNGNLVSDITVVDGNTFETEYGYNANDQLESITYPKSGRVVSYTPDTLGRPTEVSDYVSSITYWSSGQIRQINYENGTVTDYGQNNRLWPSSFATQKSGTYYTNSSYFYDGVGNLTRIADTADSTYNRTLGYDSIDRLTSISGPWGSGTINYSGQGNISSQAFGSTTLTYGYTSNRLSSVSGYSSSFGYDAYGNITSGAGNTYTYDNVPNLRCVNCSVPADKTEYTYDGTNQRVTVTKDGVKTYEVYGAQGNLLAEYTPAHADKLLEYIYLGGKRIAQRQTDTLPTATTTNLSVGPNPAGLNQSVTLTATVAGNNPTGTVSFRDGSTTLGTATLNAGRATFSTAFTVAGSRSITASYGGDATNTSSNSSSVTLVVNTLAASATTLTVNPWPVGINQPTTLTAIVSGFNPTGTVIFRNNSTTLGSASLNAGQATLNTLFSAAGTISLTARYEGDERNLGSDSTAVNFSINNPNATATTISIAFDKSQVGIGLTAKIIATVIGSSPTGKVTFYDGSKFLGDGNVQKATSISSQTTISTKFTTAGTHTITASYSGDASNLPITSSGKNIWVY